jgi:hypothetical protein
VVTGCNHSAEHASSSPAERKTSETTVGAITGPPTAPRTLLLGRNDTASRLQYTGRTANLARTASSTFTGLRLSLPQHAELDRESTGWGSREKLHVSLVVPETVVEISADVFGAPAVVCATLRVLCGCVRTRPSKTRRPSSCEGRPHEGRNGALRILTSRRSAGDDGQPLLI